MTVDRIPNYSMGEETEYETDMQSNGVFRKGRAPQLSPSDQYRLLKTTGGIDPTVLNDNHSTWNGQTLESINTVRTRPSTVRNEQI